MIKFPLIVGLLGWLAILLISFIVLTILDNLKNND